MNPQSFDPRPFIERAAWTFAKTVPDHPHEYAVEAQHVDDPDFRTFAALIEAEGYIASFSFSGQTTRYRYMQIGEHVYWVSRSLYAPGQNLNRRPVADVQGQPEHEQGRLPV